jgi:hypothetical protein
MYAGYWPNGTIRIKSGICNLGTYKPASDRGLSKKLEFINKDSVKKYFGLKNINQPICGYCSLYYPDGKLAAEGILDTTKRNNSHFWRHRNSSYIVKNGLWKYYDKDGKVYKVWYTKGEIIKKD